jgi:hypothetical protein
VLFIESKSQKDFLRMKNSPTIPFISDEEATPLVKTLLAIVYCFQEENQSLEIIIQQMRDEIAILKGEKAKPKFKSSKMDENTNKDVEVEEDDEPKKRAGSAKRSKTLELTIHEEKVVPPAEPVPAGARFKGYRDVVVQGLVIKAHNTRYRLECWQTPEGSLITGELPESLQGYHFDPVLRSYVLYQHNHCHVTQPLLLEQLREWEIDISAGQINALLSADKENFHNEKDDLLVAGLEVSPFITVDDSGARHKGKNGYVTQIGNDLFAWFASTDSKSRINFLERLHAGSITYNLTEESLIYMKEQGLPAVSYKQLQLHMPTEISTFEDWHKHLDALGIKKERHIKIATEGALLGSLIEKGLNPDLAIISDGARQFDVLLHGLCWIHAERLIHKLIPVNEQHREAIAQVRDQIWSFYADLKAYKAAPDASKIEEFELRFTEIFTQHTLYATLNEVLERLHRHKKELLLVLHRPDIPLHTNGSETDIRDYVKKRKVSGGTRSDLGRQCRDTFASLKKTCRKLGISFWQYLLDRESLTNNIPLLSNIIRNASVATASP